jgi:hypothetical protein
MTTDVHWGAPLSKLFGPARMGHEHCQRAHRLRDVDVRSPGCCCREGSAGQPHGRRCCPEHGADNARAARAGGRHDVDIPAAAELAPVRADDLADPQLRDLVVDRPRRDTWPADVPWPYGGEYEVVRAAAVIDGERFEVAFLPPQYETAYPTGATDPDLAVYVLWMHKRARLAALERTAVDDDEAPRLRVRPRSDTPKGRPDA